MAVFIFPNAVNFEVEFGKVDACSQVLCCIVFAAAAAAAVHLNLYNENVYEL